MSDLALVLMSFCQASFCHLAGSIAYAVMERLEFRNAKAQKKRSKCPSFFELTQVVGLVDVSD